MSFKSMLNKLCDIEMSTLSNVAPHGRQHQKWVALVRNVPCRLRGRNVSERRYGDVNYQKATHALYTMTRKFTAGTILRIVCEGRYYDVIGRLDLGGADKYLCFYLERYE